MYRPFLALALLVGVCASLPIPPSSPSAPIKSWPFDNDGIVNPPAYYQRYRKSEYPAGKPFFQWWYFYFSDFTNEKYFLLALGIDETHVDTNDKYFVVTFGGVDAKAGKSWHRGERFDLGVVNISNYFDVQAWDSFGNEMYHLNVINNDTYRLTGMMNHSDNVFSCVGIDPSTPIVFDITLSRINGWYGQQDLEHLEIEFAKGEIGWNPYAHNSLVQGKVMVGDEAFTFVHSSQFRGYGDMNWGERFPSGNSVSDGFNYPWGWFTAYVPNDDPTQDFALVVGTGTAEYGIPLGRVSASFADFRFNGTHLGMRHIIGWDGHSFTVPIMSTSSDGEFLSYQLTKSNFATFTDGPYKFNLPLCQTLTFDTTRHHIFLNFTTDIGLINRLVFNYGNVYFSDFEALGSQVHVVIDYKDNQGHSTNIYDFVTSGAGYEYGYETAEGNVIIDKQK